MQGNAIIKCLEFYTNVKVSITNKLANIKSAYDNKMFICTWFLFVL